MSQSLGIIFITHNSKHHLKHSLPYFLNSPLKPRVLVVNSSSTDGTVELAQQMGAETLIIPRHQFNHGATREFSRKYLGTDIVVFMTPDAYPKDDHLLEALIAPIISGNASLAYARQIPHKGADFFESFPRHFNYPEQSQIRSKADVSKYGSYTIFCSNTCAAYLNKALDQIGGFSPALFGEDTIAAAKMIEQGHSIAYVAEAVVHHSHHYSLKQEFKRHFDIGLSRKKEADLLRSYTRVEKRGSAYLRELLKTILIKNPFLIPYALAQCASKFIGYQIGRRSLHVPNWFKEKLSSQDFFWSSEHAWKDSHH